MKTKIVCPGCHSFILEYAKGLCRKCHTYEWRKRNPEKLKVITKKYYSKNKASIREKGLTKNISEEKRVKRNSRQRNYYKQNSEIIKIKNNAYSLKNKERLKKLSKKRYADNREKILAERKAYKQKDPIRFKSLRHNWYSRNKQKIILNNHIRRTRYKDGNVSIEDWENIKKKFNYICPMCNQSKQLTIDHIKPISLGGEHKIENIQPLCKTCNSSKGKKILKFNPPEHAQQ